MSFSVTTEPRDERQIAVIITVSPDRVESELRKAANKVAGQYRVPGFRKGKAPYNIIVQQFGKANLYNEFVEELGQELFQQALTQEGIEPYAQAAMEDIQLEPLTYTIVVPLEPEITLGDYRSIRVEEPQPAVDEAEVDRQLEASRDQYASWQDVDRPSTYGDLMTIDVKSVIIPAEGEAAGEETVVLDEKDWDVTPDQENPMEPPGFDEQLTGMTAGDTKEFVLGWPAEGQSVYAGKQANFTVTVKNIQAYEKPALDDAFAQMVGPDFATIDDLKNSIRETAQANEKSRAESDYVAQVLDAVIDASTLNYPPVVIEDQINGMLQDTEQRLRQLGIDSLDTFLRQTNQTMEDYRERLRPEATKIARRNLVLSEIIRTEHLTVSDEEIEERIGQMLNLDEEVDEEQAKSRNDLAGMLRGGAGRNMIVSQLLTDKAIKLVLAIARGEEPERAPEPAAEAMTEAAAEDEAESDSESDSEAETSVEAAAE